MSLGHKNQYSITLVKTQTLPPREMNILSVAIHGLVTSFFKDVLVGHTSYSTYSRLSESVVKLCISFYEVNTDLEISLQNFILYIQKKYHVTLEACYSLQFTVIQLYLKVNDIIPLWNRLAKEHVLDKYIDNRRPELVKEIKEYKSLAEMINKPKISRISNLTSEALTIQERNKLRIIAQDISDIFLFTDNIVRPPVSFLYAKRDNKYIVYIELTNSYRASILEACRKVVQKYNLYPAAIYRQNEEKSVRIVQYEYSINKLDLFYVLLKLTKRI